MTFHIVEFRRLFPLSLKTIMAREDTREVDEREVVITHCKSGWTYKNGCGKQYPAHPSLFYDKFFIVVIKMF